MTGRYFLFLKTYRTQPIQGSDDMASGRSTSCSWGLGRKVSLILWRCSIARLKAEVSRGVQINFSLEFFPAVAESKGAMTEERAGWPIKVLYRPFYEFTCLLVTSSSIFVLPNDVIVWLDGRIHPSLIRYPYTSVSEGNILILFGLNLRLQE